MFLTIYCISRSITSDYRLERSHIASNMPQ